MQRTFFVSGTAVVLVASCSIGCALLAVFTLWLRLLFFSVQNVGYELFAKQLFEQSAFSGQCIGSGSRKLKAANEH